MQLTRFKSDVKRGTSTSASVCNTGFRRMSSENSLINIESVACFAVCSLSVLDKCIHLIRFFALALCYVAPRAK